MNPLIENHRRSITELCRRYGVHRLDLFGSATGADFDPHQSDVDFMVEFTDQRPEGAADRYFGLQGDLQQVLGRPVDLVMRSAVKNPYFQKSVERQQLNLYAA
ncbi:MAG: nucleotidyltransferase domain-containing protein [Pseudomonadota bacterium]